MIKERSLIFVVILGLFTFGIYPIYWLYKISEELGEELKNDNRPGLEIILIFLTCGLYSLYLMYRNCKQITQVQAKNNMREENTAIICLSLQIFRLFIISMAIVQESMNEISRHKRGITF